MSDNIHVAVRIRPLIDRELENHSNILWDTKDSTVIYQRNSPATEYCFDRVFNINHDNAFIYEDLCAPIVRSVMEGFNGTIFAYGQTSSGKTYTMMGKDGIIPSAIHEIFDAIDNMPEREFLLRVSYMEIYNENVLDLLSDDSTKSLKTLEDNDGNIAVMGLSEEEIKTSEEVFRIMKRGSDKRHVGDTKMNDRSSRSHAIFRMIIESRMRNISDEDSVVNVGQLNLVDLAGSERSAQMGMKGERLKQGININMSLLMLTQVITQLSSQTNKHVGYRYSVLTRILQNSLGGNARTVIICTVTPASIQETVSTLNFASRAKKIKNKPTANIVSNDKALLKRYTSEIKELSQKLVALQQMGDSGQKESLEKELEEKNKQNENLKQQIQELKEKFVVSQFTIDSPKPVINKKNRRETWCGGIRHKNDSFRSKFLDPLPNLKEEPLDSNFFTNLLEHDQKDRVPSFMSPPLINFKFPDDKISIDACIQTEAIKAEDLDLQEVSQEYHDLISENHEQRTQIEDMSQQIIKLMTQISDLSNEQKSNSGEFLNLNNEYSPSNKLNIFEEIQMSQTKECMNTSAQTNESLNYIPTSVGATQTAIEPQISIDIQTEKQECLNKSAQIERSLYDTVCQTEQILEDVTCQTEFAVTMDAAVQVVNLTIESEEQKDVNDKLCINCSSKSSISNESFQCPVTVENMESMNQVLQSTLMSYELMINKLNTVSDKAKGLKLDQLKGSEVDKLCSDMQDDVVQLMKEQFITKYDERIKSLKFEIESTQMDIEVKVKKNQELENICTEKDIELGLALESLNEKKQEIWTKNDELLNWQHETSEKYDMYLKQIKDKKDLQKQVKNFENIIAKKEVLINNMKEKVEASESECQRFKAELLETIKSLAIKNEELVAVKDATKNSYLNEEKNEKLMQEITVLKTQIQTLTEYYNKVINDLKSNHEQRIITIENKLRRNYEDKILNIQKELNDQHAENLTNEMHKLEFKMLTQTSNFRLEKVKFEEEFLKANRENSSALKLKNILIKKEEECEKLKLIIEQFKHNKSNSYNEELEKMIVTKQKDLEKRESALNEIQAKLEATEKSLNELKSARQSGVENIEDLKRKKLHLESLVKERENIIKQNNSKFNLIKSGFEKEYKKLKLEIETLKKTSDSKKLTIETKLFETKDSENKVNSNISKDNDIEKHFEFNELQSRCKKMKEDNVILSRKLAHCQNEIRRIHELHNESKIGKEIPQSNSTQSPNAQFQNLLHQKEKYIARLEKENKKYQDYLKAKGHHRIVAEASTVKQNTCQDTENKPPFSDTPASASLVNKLLSCDRTSDHPSSKLKSFSPPSQRNNAPSVGMKRTTPYPNISSHQKSAFTPIKPLSDLECNSDNCRQQ